MSISTPPPCVWVGPRTFALGVDAALRRVEVLHQVAGDVLRAVADVSHLDDSARELQQ